MLSHQGVRTNVKHFPVLPFFLEFLVFCACEEFLFFSSVFPFFSGDFRGSVGITNPCFWVVFLAFFPKKTRKGRTRFLGILMLAQSRKKAENDKIKKGTTNLLRIFFRRKFSGLLLYRVHTPRWSCDNTLLRRVLRRFSRLLSRRLSEGFLEGVWRWFH